MKRAKIESVEDLEALPQDQWVFVPEGLKVRWLEADGSPVREGKVAKRPRASRPAAKRKRN